MIDSFAFSNLSRRVANLIRIGKITEVDGAQVKVAIGKVKTNWLPIVSTAGDTSVWIPITVGEQVAVISPYGEMAQSIVIRSIHYNKYAAPENKDDVLINSKANVKAESEEKFEAKFEKGFEFVSGDLSVKIADENIILKSENASITATNDTISCNSGSNSIFCGNDQITLNAGGASITLSSSGIQLNCGASSIDMSSSDISISSTNISTMPPVCKCLGGL